MILQNFCIYYFFVKPHPTKISYRCRTSEYAAEIQNLPLWMVVAENLEFLASCPWTLLIYMLRTIFLQSFETFDQKPFSIRIPRGPLLYISLHLDIYKMGIIYLYNK